MKNIIDYNNEKCIDKMALKKEEQINILLANEYFNEKSTFHLDNYVSISKKDAIENALKIKEGWEITSTGLEHRSNFRYDEKTGDLLFDRNIITKHNYQFISDGSKESDIFIKKHKKDLIVLSNYYKSNDILYERYKEKIKDNLEKIDFDAKLSQNSCQASYYARTSHLHNFFSVYGEIGKKLLIKWLNALNNTKKDIDVLIDEFDNDMDNADMYLQLNSSDITIGFWAFKRFLMQELEKYSVRGRYFRVMYGKKMEEVKSFY